MTTPNPAALEGRKFRFVVKSADEAVRLIREHLGETAKVLSVNQIQGKGLARFVASPRLEVIATVPKAEPKVAAPAPTPAPVTEKKTEVAAVKETYENASKAFEKISKEANFSKDNNLKNFDKDDRLIRDAITQQKSLEKVLEKVGFDTSLLASFKSLKHWDTLKQQSISHGLMEVADYLHNEYKGLQHRPLGKRIAFIGTPGAGKTTALCKQLSQERTSQKMKVQVLRLESDVADINDSLFIFCDVLGVKVFREGIDAQHLDKSQLLYIDTPGIALNEEDRIVTLRKQLDSWDVDSRVLVINGLYDSAQLKRLYDLGAMLQATHVVLTHLDEVSNATRLWQFVLRGGLTPLFISHGQNLTGDYTANVEAFLNQKTFSSLLVK